MSLSNCGSSATPRSAEEPPSLPRVHVRKFDYDEARRRHAAGESMRSLAREFGVADQTIKRAIDPVFRKAFDERSAAHNMSGTCELCGKEGVSSAAHRRSSGKYDGRVVCIKCRGKLRRKMLRLSSEGVLLVECWGCHEYKPLDAYFPRVARRVAEGKILGRTSLCRKCEAAKRRAYREANKVACERCGSPTEGKGRPNTRTGPGGIRIVLDPNRPYLCVGCGGKLIQTPEVRARAREARWRTSA